MDVYGIEDTLVYTVRGVECRAGRLMCTALHANGLAGYIPKRLTAVLRGFSYARFACCSMYSVLFQLSTGLRPVRRPSSMNIPRQISEGILTGLSSGRNEDVQR